MYGDNIIFVQMGSISTCNKILSSFILIFIYTKRMTDNRSNLRSLQVFDDIDNIPTQYNKRICTDVLCLIIGLGFTIIMIILAIIFFNYNNYYQVNFPADTDGVLCGIDKPGYPYVYFVNPPDISRRVCVAECPKSGDSSLNCVPTDNSGCSFSTSQGFQVEYYQNEAVRTRNGDFCFPKDEKIRNKLQQDSKLKNRNSFYNSLDTIILCFLIAIGVSIIYFLLVQFLPKPMNYAAVIAGGIAILVTAVCLFLYQTEEKVLKIIAAVILLLVLLLILMTVLKNTDSWRMHSIFLKQATIMIKDRPITLLFVPVFFIMLVGFAVMVVLQFTAYWSSGTVTFDGKTSLFHELQGFGPIVLSVLLIIQAIWGLSFIKQAFNFCVAGQAVNWYYQKNEGCMYPVKLLLCKHLGSVIAGSFMTGFFSVFDLIFDLIKPDENANPNGAYTRCYRAVCVCCIRIFDLVRSDSMAYINLTGNPFCNSSRYCEYLCGRSIIMDYSQSTSRAYRFCAHFLIVGIMALLALYIKGVISIYALLIIMVQSIFIATLLISIHADAAQAIQIVFLADQQFNRRRRQDNQMYEKADIENNLTGFRHRPQIAQQVKQQRIKQNNKRNSK